MIECIIVAGIGFVIGLEIGLQMGISRMSKASLTLESMKRLKKEHPNEEEKWH